MRKVLFAALAVMIGLSSCDNAGKNKTEGAQEEALVVEAPKAPVFTVAYVELDSLLSKYEMAIEMRNKLETKVKRGEREIASKASKFEKDVMDYQEKAQKGLITRFQAAEMENNLSQQQQSLVQDRERIMGELAEEEQVMNNKVYYAVTDYLKEYNADYKYSMIISTSSVSGPILNASPSYDITNEVIKNLNERYAKEKAAAPKKK